MDTTIAILISLFHDLFAAVWIGGIVVYFTVISYSAKSKVIDPEKSEKFTIKLNDNFGFVLFLAIILVLGTGIIFEDGISFFLGEGTYAELLGLKVLAMIALIILIIPSVAIKNITYRLIFGILHSIAGIYVIYLSIQLKYLRYGVTHPDVYYFWAVVHDLFTFVWIGGMIAYAFIILLTARAVFEKASERKVLMMAIRRNMAILALISMILLTVSGLFIFPPGNIWQYFFDASTRYNSIFLRKIITSIILLIIVVIKIFKIDKMKVPKRKKRWIYTITTINMLLAVLLVYLSVLMRYVRYT